MYFTRTKPTVIIQIYSDGVKQSGWVYHTLPDYEKTTTYSEEVIPINKSFEVGPIIKNKADINIEVQNDKLGGIDDTYDKSGNIYDFWKNGYTAAEKDSSFYFVDMSFSWRTKPKS